MGIWWFVVAFAWVLAASAAADATQLKGHGRLAGFVCGLVGGPVIGLLYAAALPDRGVQTVRIAEKDTPSVRMRAVGPDPEKWGQAKKDGKLCPACNAILQVVLQEGDRCPECSARKR